MPTRDYRDIWGGCGLIVIGVLAAGHALSTLNLGTVSQMGPGMFPVALGCLLIAFGVIIMVPALSRAGDLPDMDVRSFAAVSTSILAFALVVKFFGLIPSIVAMTFISSRADSRLSMIGTAILAAIMSVCAALIFVFGLGLQLPLFNWPW